MNKNEAAYAQHLEQLKAAGEIKDYRFEPMTLRLATLTTYRPDFLVLNSDDTMEFREVKGRTKNTFWAEEDAKVKIKVAAEQYWMFKFSIVWQQKDKTWGVKEYPAA